MSLILMRHGSLIVGPRFLTSAMLRHVNWKTYGNVVSSSLGARAAMRSFETSIRTNGHGIKATTYFNTCTVNLLLY